MIFPPAPARLHLLRSKIACYSEERQRAPVRGAAGTAREMNMVALAASQLCAGMVLFGDDGRLYRVEMDEPLAGGTLRLRDLETGAVHTRAVRPDETFEQATLDRRELQYVYQDGDGYVFLDPESDAPITLDPERAGDVPRYLREGDRAHALFHQGRPLSLEPPGAVALAVVETEPPRPGPPKPARLETGLTILVPASIAVGETVVIDPRRGTYLHRAT